MKTLGPKHQWLGYAARVMRGLIIDHARSRQAQKRGGRFEITSAGADVVGNTVDYRQLMRISDALDELVKADSSLAEVIDLKFFCGFSQPTSGEFHFWCFSRSSGSISVKSIPFPT